MIECVLNILWTLVISLCVGAYAFLALWIAKCYEVVPERLRRLFLFVLKALMIGLAAGFLLFVFLAAFLMVLFVVNIFR